MKEEERDETNRKRELKKAKNGPPKDGWRGRELWKYSGQRYEIIMKKIKGGTKKYEKRCMWSEEKDTRSFVLDLVGLQRWKEGVN